MTDWLTGFQYRKSHLILGAYKGFADFPICIKIYYGTGTDGTEKVDHLTDYWGDYDTWAGKVYCSSHCKTDFSDLRFTDNDGTTKLNYWIQEKVDGDYAIVWIKVTDDLSTDTTIFVYYGNESASSESDGDGVFLLFDDFDDGIFDTDKWIVSGSYTESGGLLTLNSGAYIQSKSTWFKEVIVFMKAKFSQANGFIGLCKTTGGTDDAAFFRGESSTIKSRVQRDSGYETGTVGAYQGNFWKFALKWLSEYPETHNSYNSVQFFVDSVGKRWHINNSPNELIPVTNNAIGLDSLIFDWIVVRKVAPAGEEPVHSSWGAEEEKHTTITIGTLECNVISWSEGQSCDPAIRQIPLNSDGEFVDTGTFVIDNRQLTITIRLTDAQKDTLNNMFNANATVTIIAKTESEQNYPRWKYTVWLSRILKEYRYSKEGSDEREWEVELEFYCSSFSYEVA